MNPAKPVGMCMEYFRNIYRAVETIAKGLRVTLPYFFARTVVVQYPEVAPVLQPRFRGFHSYEIERCIACEACAKACPVDCIRMSKTGPRKISKTKGIAVGGAIREYRIDHGTCLFCGLCIEVCPTGCLAMGAVHDNSRYRRGDLVADYVNLAKKGWRTVEPAWLSKNPLPVWAVRTLEKCRTDEPAKRELMAHADDPAFCRSLDEAPAPPRESAAKENTAKENTE
ncbi:MAG: NADH-quinone oxidoreductase subunit I [Desulfobacteraceae bacterium]|nr:MAG: NADH-quinone oxidoreductase subunit I [Desulfobacteraceae bacterium]